MSNLGLNNLSQNVLSQNIRILSNRVNELGVTEPVVQRQGANRISVQLPGVQDIARAKDIIGRTASLEIRLVDENAPRYPTAETLIPPSGELFTHGIGTPVVLQKRPIVTGEQVVKANASFDDKKQPVVSITLDSRGGELMRVTTEQNVGKLMSIVLFEENKSEVLTVATIQGIFGQNFIITGMGTTARANDLALLLRAGALAAPMKIIEERTVGPSLGADNIERGLNSVWWGFVAVAVFICIYYMLMGVFSTIALTVNLLMLVAVLSMLQATLTLPGIAAIALTLGMAIDANVLINERIREELRDGKTPQMAIYEGFERAWFTVLDSNITSLIAGLALLIFGSGPVRGFAVVHSLGILTSMFSSIVVARGLTNLWYGRRQRLSKISIGTVWKSK